MQSDISSVQVRRLEFPTDSEVDDVVAVLNAAFFEGRVTNFLVGGDKSLLPFYHGAIVRSAAIGGHLFVASVSDMKICGVALWYGPGQEAFKTEEQHAGLSALFQRMPADLYKWWTEYFLIEIGGFADSLLGVGYEKAAWQLQLLGVHPKYQRKGIGKALISAGEALAEGTSIPIFLETTNPVNVPIYERRGFVLKGQITVHSLLGEGQAFVMVKEPFAAA